MLHTTLSINGEAIGHVQVQRRITHPDDLHSAPDDVNTYDVEVLMFGAVTHKAEVSHRYGDGALTLLAKAIAAVEAPDVPLQESLSMG